MTPQQINEAVAEHLGETPLHAECVECGDVLDAYDSFIDDGDCPHCGDAVLFGGNNYAGDRNAMYEAEKKLGVGERIRYKHQIGVVMSGGSVGRAIPDWWLIHEVTPIQRAEAFLKTLNLYEE